MRGLELVLVAQLSVDNGAVLNDVMLRFNSKALKQSGLDVLCLRLVYMHSGARLSQGFINADVRLASTTPFGVGPNSSAGSTIDAGFNRLRRRALV